MCTTNKSISQYQYNQQKSINQSINQAINQSIADQLTCLDNFLESNPLHSMVTGIGTFHSMHRMCRVCAITTKTATNQSINQSIGHSNIQIRNTLETGSLPTLSNRSDKTLQSNLAWMPMPHHTRTLLDSHRMFHDHCNCHHIPQSHTMLHSMISRKCMLQSSHCTPHVQNTHWDKMFENNRH